MLSTLAWKISGESFVFQESFAFLLEFFAQAASLISGN
jgi:hypothetical protein